MACTQQLSRMCDERHWWWDQQNIRQVEAVFRKLRVRVGVGCGNSSGVALSNAGVREKKTNTVVEDFKLKARNPFRQNTPCGTGLVGFS